MSRPAGKSSQSGLRTVQRDWSDSKSSQESLAPRSSQDIKNIDWPMTQREKEKPKLSPAEMRLRAIEAALAGTEVPSHKPPPLAGSRSFNKRPSTELAHEEPASKKARQLPASWADQKPTHHSRPAASSSSKPPQTTHSPAPVATSSSSGPSASSSKPELKKVAKVFLSSEQKQILKLVEDGKSVFYTGSAGTGKSVLLREIIRTMRKKHIRASDAVAITASTGIAACNIGGITIHSFAGIGLGIESAEVLATKIKKNRKASSRWLRTKVLIIDEVSMLDGDLFDKLARIGGMLRKSSKPFGGIQIVVTGDFFQLPPVTKGSSSNVKFAFEAEEWNKTIDRTFNLTQVFRQKDEGFVRMLNEMRFGSLSPESIAKFKTLSRPLHYTDGIAATELFPLRQDVERSNMQRLNNLNTESKAFGCVDTGEMDKDQRSKILSGFMAPEKLVLKVDAQVMLIKNMDEFLVNGSMGRIVRFTDQVTYAIEKGAPQDIAAGPPNSKKGAAVGGGGPQYPVVEWLMPNGTTSEMLVVPEKFSVEGPGGTVQASRSQLPLILSWAMSIHKSQGQTLDRVKVDLGKVFEKGQAYVALSRATSLEGLQVLNFNADKVLAHPKVIAWSRTLETIKDN